MFWYFSLEAFLFSSETSSAKQLEFLQKTDY